MLAVSAALELSSSSHLSDIKGELVSQVTKSSIGSSVLISNSLSLALYSEAMAALLSNPSKLNPAQKSFSVTEISPTLL